jgi:hypothetical protein
MSKFDDYQVFNSHIPGLGQFLRPWTFADVVSYVYGSTPHQPRWLVRMGHAVLFVHLRQLFIQIIIKLTCRALEFCKPHFRQEKQSYFAESDIVKQLPKPWLAVGCIDKDCDSGRHQTVS